VLRYRGLEAGESEADYGRRLADELEQRLLELGPETVCAFVAETVVGAALGTVPPVEGYFAGVRAVCEKYGVLLILDEIMCGMGRTGPLHACEAEGISADMIVVGKGLGAGFQPVGAVLVSARVQGGIAEGSGVVKHGFTYMAHPVACAAALAVQRAISGRDLLANVRRQGEVLRQRLESRFGNHPFVGDIRGRGLFWALELVRDRGTKEPFDPALALHARIKAEGLARGLICYPGAGTADGERGDHVIISPPFIVTEAEIDEIVERLGDTLDAALASAGV
jgi:adenosylmethionine-8-amino-7-oxononanoate aminotransferase